MRAVVTCLKEMNEDFTKNMIYDVLSENGKMIKLTNDSGESAWIESSRFSQIIFIT